MATDSVLGGRLAQAQWQRLGKLIRAHRHGHRLMKQEEFAARLTEAVRAAAADAGVAAPIERYGKSEISRIEAWTKPPGARKTKSEGREPRLPRVGRTFQLRGLADVLGMTVEDMLRGPGDGMAAFELDAPAAQVAVLGETLQRHEKKADHAIVWSRHLISMYFPHEALHEYYNRNYVVPALGKERREAMKDLADRWVAAAEERREAVLGRAASRSWRFTNVVFASDLDEVVYGRDRFAGIDPALRAGCLEGLLRTALETPNCGIAILDDTGSGAASLRGLRQSVGALTHLSNMGDGCVILHDLLGVWHVGEAPGDVRDFRSLLEELAGRARYSRPDGIEPFLLSRIQKTLLAVG